MAGARNSGNKIAASAHGMGSGGLAVDAMAIGCLGVELRVERFFSYLAIFCVVFCVQPPKRFVTLCVFIGVLPKPVFYHMVSRMVIRMVSRMVIHMVILRGGGGGGDPLRLPYGKN